MHFFSPEYLTNKKISFIMIIEIKRGEQNMIILANKTWGGYRNTDEFREDVDDLLNAYIGVDLDQMDGIFDDLMNVMINHNIVLPREFVMI